MSLIRTTADGSAEGSAAVSVLNALLKAGIPIRHDCGGKARCGTCRIRVVEGIRLVSRKTGAEISKLGKDAPDDSRLACQSYPFGDITVQIPDNSDQESKKP